MIEDWTRQEYAAALAGLRREVAPEGAGRWATFLRETLSEEIGRLEEQILAMHGLHKPEQQEQFNLLAGEIRGLRRFLKPDLGLGDLLKAKIEENH